MLKIQLRELFGPEANLDWDDPLPDKHRSVWISLLAMLIQMGEIVIKRSVRPSGVEEVPELIGFADGSLSAYACAIYVRWTLLKTLDSDPDQFDVRLVCAKARVAPVKGITAPRSEISGFLILTRLLKVLVNAMEIKPSRITIAVDSQCTISAIEKSGGVLAPYFAARVSESMTNLAEVAEEILVDPVLHVPGPLNPADIPTRGNTTPDEVREGSTWQNGPEYLRLPRYNWPFSREFLDVLPESEMKAPRAAFNLIATAEWECCLGTKLSGMILDVMLQSNATVKRRM